MNYAADYTSPTNPDFDDEFDLRDSDFHGVQESISDWAIASDETGATVYCEQGIAGFLSRDAH